MSLLYRLIDNGTFFKILIAICVMAMLAILCMVVIVYSGWGQPWIGAATVLYCLLLFVPAGFLVTVATVMVQSPLRGDV